LQYQLLGAGKKDLEFKASLDYIVRLSLTTTTKQKKSFSPINILEFLAFFAESFLYN
jgi:hypothetical protein